MRTTSCLQKSEVVGEPKEVVRISVVDDDGNDRLLIKRTLDQWPDLECVGLYNGGLEALKRIPSSASDVVLIDVRMPGMSGISLAQRLKEMFPTLTIIMVSVAEDLDALKAALLVGAGGFLHKPVIASECRQAILFALAGGCPLSKALSKKLTSLVHLPESPPWRGPCLDDRESAIMHCLASGLQNKEIADKLGLRLC